MSRPTKALFVVAAIAAAAAFLMFILAAFAGGLTAHHFTLAALACVWLTAASVAAGALLDYGA